MYAFKGIFFYHESQRRGNIFVTRKFPSGLAYIVRAWKNPLHGPHRRPARLGARQILLADAWMILQQDQSEYFVIATGNQYRVRQFVEWTATKLAMPLRWQCLEVNEVGYWNYKSVVKSDIRFFRPTKAENLRGDDLSKAKQKLG